MTPPDLSAALTRSTHDDIHFVLTIDGQAKSKVSVEWGRGLEALSEIFVYEVVLVTSDDGHEDFTTALSKDMSIAVLRNKDVVRTVHGIVAEVHPDGATLSDPRRRRLTLVILPKLAELQRTKVSRTWKRSDEPSQGLTTRNIIDELLGEWQVKARWQLDRELEKNVLRTQFCETNYDFTRRLLAFEGTHFYFLHEVEATTVILTDTPGKLQDADSSDKRPKLPFCDVGAAVAGEHIRNLRREVRTRTDGVTLSDFSYERPTLDMAVATEVVPDSKYVFYEHPGGYARPSTGDKIANRRLEELNESAHRLFGESNCPRLAAGFSFEVTGHRDTKFNGPFVATDVSFAATGRGSAAFSSELSLRLDVRAVPATVPLRPKSRPWPVPPIQTAMVVGPRHDAPHTKAPGLVKVRFYWEAIRDSHDRDMSEQDFNEARCAWARVTTDMAGAVYGTTMWPRAGMEVVVDFLNGNIDEPVVVRCLYPRSRSRSVATGGVCRVCALLSATWMGRCPGSRPDEMGTSGRGRGEP